MKRLILLTLCLPLTGIARYDRFEPTATNLADVRTGKWPINLERDIDRRDTSYSLIFRDQQVINEEVLDTLPFQNLEQLKYLGKALVTLKTGHTGDIARFKDYSVKRADKMGEGTWYLLRYQWGLTDFQQAEADIMIKTIKGL